MELNINTSAYFNQYYGADDEVYRFCQNAYMYFKEKEYTKQDLMNPQKLEELFDYCQILEGYITRRGWEFLIKHYGYNGLFEIDKKSGWLCKRTDGSIEEYIECVEYEIKSMPE